MTTATAPTTADFQRALQALAPLKPYGLKLLKAHYMAPDHTVTATELAALVDYGSYTNVCRWYGEFAGQLCAALGLSREFNVLLESALPGDQEGHLQLVLAPALVEALDELCWSWAR